MTPAILIVTALTGQASQAHSLLAELHTLDRALTSAEERLLTLESQSSSLAAEIAELETRVAALRVKQARDLVRYRRRIRALARHPTGARLAVLGGSRSLSDYLQSTRLLRQVSKHDRQLYGAYNEQAEKLGKLQQVLDTRREEIEGTATSLRRDRDDVAEKRRQRAELLASVTQHRDVALRVARESRQAASTLGNMVRKLEPKGRLRRSFGDNKGRLPWPAEGRVAARFGQQVEMAFGTVVTHGGVDIAAPAGARVQAVAPGTVAYAGWLKGYGQLVIVDHGEGYHAVMGHLGSIAVVQGNVVDVGETLGAVGDTGSLRGTVLYFELRQQGKPIDPEQWLRRQ